MRSLRLSAFSAFSALKITLNAEKILFLTEVQHFAAKSAVEKNADQYQQSGPWNDPHRVPFGRSFWQSRFKCRRRVVKHDVDV